MARFGPPLFNGLQIVMTLLPGVKPIPVTCALAFPKAIDVVPVTVLLWPGGVYGAPFCVRPPLVFFVVNPPNLRTLPVVDAVSVEMNPAPAYLLVIEKGIVVP